MFPGKNAMRTGVSKNRTKKDAYSIEFLSKRNECFRNQTERVQGRGEDTICRLTPASPIDAHILKRYCAIANGSTRGMGLRKCLFSAYGVMDLGCLCDDRNYVQRSRPCLCYPSPVECRIILAAVCDGLQY